MAPISALLLLATATAVLAVPQFDKYLLMPNTSVSQTGVGSFIWPLATNYLSNRYADWIMDFENQRLRFTLGNTNQTGYTQLFALSSLSYVVEFNPATNSLFCFSVPITFQYILGVYFYPYVRYLGDSVINNRTYHMYTGLSPDPLTQTNIGNIAIVDAITMSFISLPIMATNGFIYYAFPNVTLGTPAASYYNIPSICNVSTPTCTPACGSNAQCVNQTCVCYAGFYGNATVGCVPYISSPQQIGPVNFPYDQYVLQSGADAVSQTCTGSYNNPITNTSVYSAWVQNLQNNTIRWDVGTPGVSGSVSYYFLNSTGYTVTYTANNGMTCNKTNQMTFSQAFNNLFYPTMRYLGINTTYNNVSCRMYAGFGVPNPNTSATNMIKYISTTGSQFYFLAMLNFQGYTYYDYPNVTLGTPASSWFVVPAVCAGNGNASGSLSQLMIALFAGLVLNLLRSQ